MFYQKIVNRSHPKMKKFYKEYYPESGKLEPSLKNYKNIDRQSYAGVAPKAYKRPSAIIIDDLVQRLTLHSEIDPSHIFIHCHDGMITLDGTVKNQKMKDLSEANALSVLGVIKVKNQIKINQSKEEL